MRESASTAAVRLRLSVVVPTWNEAGTLPRLLRRLSAAAGVPGEHGPDQDGPDEDAPDEDGADEVVVADGGSTDGTARVALAHGAELVSVERGRGRQLAAGAARATGDLLVILHADACPEPGALAAARAAFAREPDLVAAGFRQRIEGRGRFFRWVERAADARVRLFGLVYGDSGLCVRSADYRAVGGFPAQPLFEDVELSRRLRRRGRVRLLDGALLRVSPRRWNREGRVRATVRNWILTTGYWCGVDPERLARFYPLPAADERRSA